MDKDRSSKKFESVFTQKVRAGKRRTYFFDVRKTKGEDFYITLTESTRRFNGEGYERHKIFLYKEDFNRFVEGLVTTIDHVKTELMPDYDYDEYTRRNLEWEEKRRLEKLEEEAQESSTVDPDAGVVAEGKPEAEAQESESEAQEPEPEVAAEEISDEVGSSDTEEEMSW